MPLPPAVAGRTVARVDGCRSWVRHPDLAQPGVPFPICRGVMR
jgi:hypothetical protein